MNRHLKFDDVITEQDVTINSSVEKIQGLEEKHFVNVDLEKVTIIEEILGASLEIRAVSP